LVKTLRELLNVAGLVRGGVGDRGRGERQPERAERDQQAHPAPNCGGLFAFGTIARAFCSWTARIVGAMTLERRTFEALGGNCEIYAVGIDAGRLRAAESWVHEMHDRLTRFSPESELSRFNASAGRWAEVSPLLESLLRESLRAHDLSDGLVNAAVLPAVLAAGYARTFSLGPTPVTASVVPPALPDVLDVRPGSARLNRGASIDLGGIAKGWLADRLAADLGPNALVNLCGDLYARGGGETGDGWPVGMPGMEKTVLLLDMGAATSGTRKRSWGAELHHLIDPRTGLPSGSDLAEASVIARSGADAEIFAKAALLLGSAEAERYLAAHDALGWSLTA
jgi:thiamine biosynthesis lipoprotein